MKAKDEQKIKDLRAEKDKEIKLVEDERSHVEKMNEAHEKDAKAIKEKTQLVQ
jgi:hypothetical protein